MTEPVIATETKYSTLQKRLAETVPKMRLQRKSTHRVWSPRGGARASQIAALKEKPASEVAAVKGQHARDVEQLKAAVVRWLNEVESKTASWHRPRY